MTVDSMMRDVLVEREYEAHHGAGGEARRVVLRIGQPRPDSRGDGDWMCPVQVVGLGDDDVLEVNGVDAVQALYLAMQIAGVKLANPPRGVTITWLGQADLGLPLPDAAGAAEIEDDEEPE